MKIRNWISPMLWVFLAGFLVIGPLDLFQTCSGIQSYQLRRAVTPQCNWPWFIPFQMGFSGMLLLIGWVFFKNNLSGRFKRRDSRFERETLILFPISAVMVVIGYLLGFYLVDSPWHLNWYLFAWIASVFYLALNQSRIYILAFLLIGVTGILVECVLLDSAVGFFRYTQQDILGRAPAWLLFVYGWTGVFIQEVSRKLDPENF